MKTPATGDLSQPTHPEPEDLEPAPSRSSEGTRPAHPWTFESGVQPWGRVNSCCMRHAGVELRSDGRANTCTVLTCSCAAGMAGGALPVECVQLRTCLSRIPREPRLASS